MANVAGPTRFGNQIRFSEFQIVSAGATEVLSVAKGNVLACSLVYLAAGAPTPATFVYDISAGTVTVAGHQAGSNFKVQVWSA